MIPLIAPGLMPIARENASAATLPTIASTSASSSPGSLSMGSPGDGAA